MLTMRLKRRITPHIATKTTGREAVHQRVRRLSRTVGYRLSQRARKKIEEFWGEAKCCHGFRRFQRLGLVQVRDEAYLMGVAAQSEAAGNLTSASGLGGQRPGRARPGDIRLRTHD